MRKIVHNSILLIAITGISLILRLIIKYELNFALLDSYILFLEAVVCLLCGVILMLVYGLFNLCFPHSPTIIKSLLTGVTAVLIAYFLSVFGGGFILRWKLSSEAIRGLLPVLLSGLILPYLHIWVNKNSLAKSASMHQ